MNSRMRRIAVLWTLASMPNHIFAETFEYTIALLPDEACSKQISGINTQVANVLSGMPNLQETWHIKLYHAVYGEEDLKKITDILDLSKLQSIKLDLTAVHSYEDKWVNISVAHSDILEKMHQISVNSFSAFHKGMLSRINDSYANLKYNHQQQAVKYGVNDILEYYKPVITVFYIYPSNPSIQAVEKIVSLPTPIACNMNKIAVGKTSYNGNIIELVYSKTLAK